MVIPLGRGDKSSEYDGDGGDFDEVHEVDDELVILRGHSSELLEFIKKPFDQVALFVECLVVSVLVFSMTSWRDDGIGIDDGIHQPIGVISSVCQHRAWLDVSYLKARQHGRIVSVAAIVTVGANTEGRHEILVLAIGPSEIPSAGARLLRSGMAGPTFAAMRLQTGGEALWSDVLRTLNRRGLTGVKLVISDAHEGLKAAAAKVLGATWQRCRVHFMRNVLAFMTFPKELRTKLHFVNPL